MARVKICGVNSADAFDAAAEAGADWIGFVFFERSPRHVTAAQASALSARVKGGPQRVGLFVDPTDDTLASVLQALHLNVLQLYATQTRINEIGTAFGVPMWRSVPVALEQDLPQSLGAESALVIEPRPPPGTNRPGGNAALLEHALLTRWKPGFPWLLAGGLRPDNVGEAIRISGAEAVDVSSGVETAPGHKDPALIKAFIAAARDRV